MEAAHLPLGAAPGDGDDAHHVRLEFTTKILYTAWIKRVGFENG